MARKDDFFSLKKEKMKNIEYDNRKYFGERCSHISPVQANIPFL